MEAGPRSGSADGEVPEAPQGAAGTAVDDVVVGAVDDAQQGLAAAVAEVASALEWVLSQPTWTQESSVASKELAAPSLAWPWLKQQAECGYFPCDAWAHP